MKKTEVRQNLPKARKSQKGQNFHMFNLHVAPNHMVSCHVRIFETQRDGLALLFPLRFLRGTE